MKRFTQTKRNNYNTGFSNFLDMAINPHAIDSQYVGGCSCVSAAPFSCSSAGYVPGTFTYEECVSDAQITCIEIGACL